jgi:hypothetical protein
MKRVDDRIKQQIAEYARRNCRERPKHLEVENSRRDRHHTDVTIHFEKQRPVTISVHDMMLSEMSADTLGSSCEKSYLQGAVKNAAQKRRKY